MDHDEWAFLSAVDLAAAIRARELSAVEVTHASLERIERINPLINAFCTSMADEALETARRIDDSLLRGEEVGPLAGVPVSVKDIVAITNVRMTCGSKLLENNVTREDAPVVERLRKAGAVLIGRTNTPEFGWKGVTDNRIFGVTRNPWNLDLTPGGSSGGASAAVAAGLGPVGIGTDGGGSLRIPAGFTATVGYKASFGRIPNYPATAVDSLRHTGPITRTVADAALVVAVLAGPDERDPNSLPADAPRIQDELNAGIEGLRIAYSPDLGYAIVNKEVARICEATAARFAEAGATVETVELNWQDPFDFWKVLFHGGIAAFLAHRLEKEGDLLDPGLRDVAELGVNLTAVDFVNATFARNRFWQTVHPLFDRFDLLVTPALAVLPFPVGQNDPDPPPAQEGRSLSWTPFTYPFNLTGQPAVSVPAGWAESNLPVGLQIVGRRFADASVLRAARALEEIQPWADRRPVLAVS